MSETIHFNNTGMLMSVFLKDIFQQSFKVQKIVFMKYVIVISYIIRSHSLSFSYVLGIHVVFFSFCGAMT